MNDYIAKPIEPDQLAEKILDWCGLHDAEDAASRSGQATTAARDQSAPHPDEEPLQALMKILENLGGDPSARDKDRS